MKMAKSNIFKFLASATYFYLIHTIFTLLFNFFSFFTEDYFFSNIIIR